MKIKIEMDMPRWLSRVILASLPVAIVAIAAWSYADVPNTFKAGDKVSAQKMMENFNTLQDRIAAFASRPQSFSAHVLANGTVDNVKGDWISSASRYAADGSYLYHVYYKAGVFGTPPNCTCSVVYQNYSGCNGATVCNVVGIGSGSDDTRLEFQVTNILGTPLTYVGLCDMSLVCSGSP